MLHVPGQPDDRRVNGERADDDYVAVTWDGQPPTPGCGDVNSWRRMHRPVVADSDGCR
jgi:hypothetical protein